jgi:UDP-glucose:(galactosyl)LPS alpha-1,2-glucosyltransferase
MHLVFCVDKNLLGPLHVAAGSALACCSDTPNGFNIHIFSSNLATDDINCLRCTLDSLNKPYDLKYYILDPSSFEAFEPLRNSIAPYFRLVVADILDVDRFLYLDADILCKADLSALFSITLEGHPVGLVMEAPLDNCADQDMATLLGPNLVGYYYNSGVMLVDVLQWRKSKLTSRCLELIRIHRPAYHDQTALNYLLRGNIVSLPLVFNTRTNDRQSWPDLKPPHSGMGRVLHFVDFPKPWSPLGRWIHPMGNLWWTHYRTTSHFRQSTCTHSWQNIPLSVILGKSYRRSIKDAIIFKSYSLGLLRRVKGIISLDYPAHSAPADPGG